MKAVFEEPTSSTASYEAPYTEATGEVRSSIFRPDGYSLWKVSAELEAGAELRWDEGHGDEGIFVLSGDLEHEGRHTGAEGVVLVESGVAATVRVTEPSRILHFGPVSTSVPTDGPFGPPATEGRHVHVFTAEDGKEIKAGAVTYFSDGGCPTCRIALFTVDRRNATEPSTSPSHKHSQDEIIHIIEGSLGVGSTTVTEGMAMAIPADLRYGFRARGTYRFINYRADGSTTVHAPGSEPELETRERVLKRVALGLSKP